MNTAAARLRLTSARVTMTLVMERWTILGPQDARSAPWRNGRGATSELAIWPEHASFSTGDFEWRVSMASVTENGPFSAFDGFTRALVVVDGTGLVLDHGEAGGRARLRPLEPYTFDGGWATTAELHAGPVRDFGVLAHSDLWRIELEALRLGARRARLELEAREHGFLHVLNGELTVRLDGEEDEAPLEAKDSLWVRPSRRGAELELTGMDASAIALFARISPSAARDL
ncbi:MAG: HutD family protein [Planctomycetota bacterium]